MFILESVQGVSLQNLTMIVPKALLCMMSVISATCLLMPCDSAVVKTGKLLYDMNYITYLPSTTLLTGSPYNFVTYPTYPARPNYCIHEGKRYSVKESIHTHPCTNILCAFGVAVSLGEDFYYQNYECMLLLCEMCKA